MIGAIKNKIQPVIDTVNSVRAAVNKPQRSPKMNIRTTPSIPPDVSPKMNIRTTPSIPPGLVGRHQPVQPMKKGGKVKCMAKGGSASKRADGCATKGKTKGRII